MLPTKVFSSRSKEAKRARVSNDPDWDDTTTYRHTCTICEEDHPTSSHDEISKLVELVPQLDNIFTIKKKIGEGTFSCVYLAKLKLISRKFPQSNHQYVALKHVIPTTPPDRILFEIDCMHRFGVHPNIITIHSCLRYDQHVVMVMDYFKHDRFIDYINLMDIAEIGNYMANLLKALQFVHRGSIIHRDVKPSNFLYNRKQKRFALVDFGLAQTASIPAFSTYAIASTSTSSIAGVNNQAEDLRIEASNMEVQRNNNHHILDQKNKSFVRLLPGPSNSLGSFQSTSHHQLTIRSGDVSASITNNNEQSPCDCKARAQVCDSCLNKPVQNASRAGTPGFRPPEVLLKHPHQTTAVDIWSAGIIFICLLSRRYPFFRSADDLAALAEITSIFGSTAIKNAAVKLEKRFQCAPERPTLTLKSVCEVFRPEIKKISKENEQWANAFDLLTRMLDVNPDTRITASKALQHPFFVFKTT